MALTLYYDPTDNTSMMVVAVLNYLQISFDTKVVNVKDKENETEDFKQISPDGKIPAIQDEGDFNVYGGPTILKYLIQDRGIEDELYSMENLQQRSTINAYIDHEQMVYRLPMQSMIKMYDENPKKFSQDGFKDEDLEEKFTKLYQSFDKLTEILDRKEGPFIMGECCTLADYVYFFSTLQAITLFKASLDKHPEVQQWYDRIIERSTVADAVSKYKESINE